MNKVVACVTGMHRSGTTWIGSVTDNFDDIASVYEPTNFKYGLKNVPRWYVDARYAQDRDFVDRMIVSLGDGTAEFRRNFDFKRPAHSVARKLFGSRPEREWRSSLKNSENRLVLKDSTLLMMAPYLAEKGVHCLVSVRHPAAIANSLKRMGWQASLAQLEGRMSKAAAEKRPSGEVAELGLYWSEIYRPVFEYLQNGGVGVSVLSHEDMFEDIELTYERIRRALDATDSQGKALSYARQSTSSEQVDVESKVQHSMSRDSRTLAKAFRRKTSPEDMRVYEEMAGDVYDGLRSIAFRQEQEAKSLGNV